MTRQPVSALAIQLQREIRKDPRVIGVDVADTWLSIQLTWDGMAKLAEDIEEEPVLTQIENSLHARLRSGRLEWWAVFRPEKMTQDELIAQAKK